MSIKKHLVLCLIPLSILPITCNSADITQIDFEDVEARINNQYTDINRQELGKLPIRILARDEQNYLKIRTPKGQFIWINGSDVTTERLEEMKPCQGLTSSIQTDRTQYGGRGQGERCK